MNNLTIQNSCNVPYAKAKPEIQLKSIKQLLIYALPVNFVN